MAVNLGGPSVAAHPVPRDEGKRFYPDKGRQGAGI